jgi:alpha-tubulin suppressor-like RCC1 family protein
LTNLTCDEVKGLTITAGVAGRTEVAAPYTSSVVCTSAGARGSDLGTIVAFPGDSKELVASLKVVIGVTEAARSCNASNGYRGCIVARRNVGFVPRRDLGLTVLLRRRCENVPCTDGYTCGSDGSCVRADVNADACDREAKCSPIGDGDGTGPGGDGFGDDAAASNPDGAIVDAGRGDGGYLGEPQKSVSPGYDHTCAVLSGGRVKCWGSNASGKLGLGDTKDRGGQVGDMGPPLPVVNLGANRRAYAVYAGGAHTCALLTDGSVKCWGDNAFGQLGYGDTMPRGSSASEMGDALPVVDLGPGHFAKSLALGVDHTCAILEDDHVKCWGRSFAYESSANIGDQPGEMGGALPAVDLGSSLTTKSITAWGSSTCAILDNAILKCWGGNTSGQLGLGDTAVHGDDVGEMGDNLPAVDLGPGRSAVSVTMSQLHTCAVLDDTSVKCWGANSSAQLGIGSFTAHGDGPLSMGSNLPAVNLGTGHTARQVVAGQVASCALLEDGAMKCWGTNVNGTTCSSSHDTIGGSPSDMGNALLEIRFAVDRIVSIAGHGAHMCAMFDNQTIRCWGYNAVGQLGYEDTFPRGDTSTLGCGDLPPVALE